MRLLCVHVTSACCTFSLWIVTGMHQHVCANTALVFVNMHLFIYISWSDQAQIMCLHMILKDSHNMIWAISFLLQIWISPPLWSKFVHARLSYLCKLLWIYCFIIIGSIYYVVQNRCSAVPPFSSFWVQVSWTCSCIDWRQNAVIVWNFVFNSREWVLFSTVVSENVRNMTAWPV